MIYTVGWIDDSVFNRRSRLSPDGGARRIATTASKLLKNGGVSTEAKQCLKHMKKSFIVVGQLFLISSTNF